MSRFLLLLMAHHKQLVFANSLVIGSWVLNEDVLT